MGRASERELTDGHRHGYSLTVGLDDGQSDVSRRLDVRYSVAVESDGSAVGRALAEQRVGELLTQLRVDSSLYVLHELAEVGVVLSSKARRLLGLSVRLDLISPLLLHRLYGRDVRGVALSREGWAPEAECLRVGRSTATEQY